MDYSRKISERLWYQQDKGELESQKEEMENSRLIITDIKNIDLKFQTAPTLFSPKAIDKGTLAMLLAIDFTPEDKVLDLGCGYGVVGILAAKIIGQEKVTMCDISPMAVTCARKNAVLNKVPQITIVESNGLDKIEDKDFSLILSNPPYHADFSVPKHFIEKGYRKLAVNGRMVMVTKRREWYKRKFISVFGGVKVFEVGGYYIFIGERRSHRLNKTNIYKE